MKRLVIFVIVALVPALGSAYRLPGTVQSQDVVSVSHDRQLTNLDVRSASTPTPDDVTADIVMSTSADETSKYRRRKVLKKLLQKYKTACPIPKSPRCGRLVLVLTNALVRSGTDSLVLRKPDAVHRLPRSKALLCLNYMPSVGIVRYDPSTHVCCNGLFNRTSPTQFCCAGFIIEGTEQDCCGTNIYNLTQFQDGEIKNFICCGDKVIDSDEHTCIGGVVMGIGLHTDGSSNSTIKPILVHEQFPDSANNTDFHTNYTDNHHNVSATNPPGGGDGTHSGPASGTLLFIGSTVTGIVIILTVGTTCYMRRKKRMKEESAYQIPYPINMGDNSLPHSITPRTDARTGTTPVSHYSINMEMSNGPGNLEDEANINETQMLSLMYNSIEQIPNGNTPIARNHVHSDKDSVLTDFDESFDKRWEHYEPNDKTFLPGNLLSDHFISTSTQTGAPKQCNRRTIFGCPFECSAYLDIHGRTMQMPSSDVKMSLPASCLGSHPVEVHGSTFPSITSSTHKLITSEDEDLASPVVEYSLTGLRSLDEHACVELPFIGSPREVKVFKFASNEGMGLVESIPVPKRGKNNDDLDLDLPYCVIKGNTAFIYTRSFSGFYCTTNRHRRELNLRTFLFGSFKRFNPDRYEVLIRMYIADELVKFADYKPRMLELEAGNGRRLFVDEKLELPDDKDLNERGALLAKIAADRDTWMHKLRPDSDQPLLDADQRISLREIVATCPECGSVHACRSDMPYCVRWYMTNKPGHRPQFTFQCVIDVEVWPEDSQDSFKSKPRIIDELQLRPEDQLPVEEMNEGERIEQIKRFIIGLRPVEQDSILDKLRSKHGIHYASTTEDVFNKLYDFYKPGGIINLVITSLRELNMHAKLDVLIKQEVIPTQLIPKPIRAVAENQQHGNEASLTGEPIHADVTTVHNGHNAANGLTNVAGANNAAATNHAAHNQYLLPKVNNVSQRPPAAQASRHRRDLNGQHEMLAGACANPLQTGSPHQDTEEEGISNQLINLETPQAATGGQTGIHRDSSFTSIYNRHNSLNAKEDSACVQPSECRRELDSDVAVSEDSRLCRAPIGGVVGETTPMLSDHDHSTGDDETALKEPYEPPASSEEDV